MFAASKSGSADAKDANFKNVTMLLHGNGTNGAQNNTFVDSSTNNFTITRNGNTTQGTFSPYGSNWSNYFDGAGDYLDAGSQTAYAFGTGDFTMECWIFATTASDSPIYEGRANGSSSDGFTLTAFSSSVIRIYSGSALISSSGTTYLNQWTHVAVCRASGTTTLYINGTSVGTSASLGNNATGSAVVGGGRYGGTTAVTSYFTGYISNFRLVKGTAVYTSNFTPSTTPLTAISGTSLLTCQSNRFIDNSTNNFTITRNGDTSVQRFSPFKATSAYSTSVIGGSGYFDGSGDYLRVAYNSNLYPTSSGTDYTVECWVYPTAGTGGLQFILGTNNTIVADWTFTQDAGQWGFTLSGVGGNAGTVIANQWTHLAMTRNGTTVNGYVNGARVLTTTASTQSNNGLPVNIGMRNGSDRAFTGYITDVRIVNGTAVYTGTSYTVPTAPLTAVTNTQFLSNNTNAGILDNAMMNDLETVGNAQISTSVKKYGTGSLAFDGTGDWLLYPSSPNLNYGSGDFTIELWVYVSSAPGGDAGLVDQRPASTNGNYFMLGIDSSRRLFIYVNSAYKIGPSSGTTLNTTTWYHVAYTRTASTGTLYVNGTSVGTWSDTTTYVQGPGFIGHHAFNAADFNGYIDDLRITKGVARYTSNFTPPTAAFPNN